MKQTVSGTQKELIEQAAQVIATDNAELATAFLQKTAVEKAIPEIDKHLTTVCALAIIFVHSVLTKFCVCLFKHILFCTRVYLVFFSVKLAEITVHLLCE